MEIGVIAVSSGLLDHIGRVEPAAQPRLQQQQIGRRLGEGEEGRRGGDLEQGDQLAAIGGFGAGEAIDQKVLGDRRRAMRPREHDALMEIDEMRRGIDMHALAERLGDGAGEGEEGALAVGAGDMHHRRQLLLGMPSAASRRSMRPSDKSIDCGCSFFSRSSSVSLDADRGRGAARARRCGVMWSIPRAFRRFAAG